MRRAQSVGRPGDDVKRTGRTRRIVGWILITLGFVSAAVGLWPVPLSLSVGESAFSAWGGVVTMNWKESGFEQAQLQSESEEIPLPEWTLWRWGLEWGRFGKTATGPAYASIVITPWPISLLMFIVGALVIRRSISRPGLCPECGYSLAGLGETLNCPECGSLTVPASAARASRSRS